MVADERGRTTPRFPLRRTTADGTGRPPQFSHGGSHWFESSSAHQPRRPQPATVAAAVISRPRGSAQTARVVPEPEVVVHPGLVPADHDVDDAVEVLPV